MLLVNYWDTEDYLSAPDAGSDDIILTVAEAARAAGFRTTFCIMGEKVRSLVGRRRDDVIGEIAAHHDICLHYNYGSIHPTTCELMTTAGWEDGVAVALSRERPGFRLLESVFGRCTALTRHGSTFAPQIVHACGVEGKAFWDSWLRIPESAAYWFCNTLCFQAADNHALDTSYSDDNAFRDDLARTVRSLEGARDTGVRLATYFGHPHRTICDEFADVSYYGGRNALWEEMRPPRPLTSEQRARVHANLPAALRAIAGLSGVEVVTVGNLVSRFGERPPAIEGSAVRELARSVLDAGAPTYSEAASAGEGLLAVAESLVLLRGRGGLPRELRRRTVLGPLSVPPGLSAPVTLEWDAVVDIASEVLAHARTTGHLPAAVARSVEIGLGSVMVGLARAYVDAVGGSLGPVTFGDAPPWPSVAETFGEQVGAIPGWACHSPEMNVSRIAHYSRLMSWTLRPVALR